MAKHNNRGRSHGRFVLLRHDMMDSPAWRSLSPVARCLWLEVMKRYNSHNNGSIPLGCREAAGLILVSKDTASRAFNELLNMGFLRIGQDSCFDLKTKATRRWTLTHETHNGRAPTGEWKKLQKSKDSPTMGTHGQAEGTVNTSCNQSGGFQSGQQD